ncbi:hypothetical protein ACH5RR_003329 [Cinchona calisaya]|uniref:O-fucosyltransferase family protein n=1 Tax=Cinchona calisaya TaxID=153742 RepID=A0ABD3AUN2_9GENT
MAMDLRQVVAAILTMSMFVMLGNMIKKDHIDPFLVNVPVPLSIHHDMFKGSRNSLVQLFSSNGPWKKYDEAMTPCWRKLPINNERKPTKSYIFFSLSNGPEYHASQIASAIMIAKHLGAALVLPDIKGVKVSQKRMFGEIYDQKKFVTSLDGIVQVVKDHHTDLKVREKVMVVSIPKRVTREFIGANIEPILRKRKQVRLASQNSSLTMTGGKEIDDYLNPYGCLTMFESLQLQREIQELVDSMVRALRFLSWKSSSGRFIAVDLKVDEFIKPSCQKNDTISTQYCYGAKEIGQFLKKIGFGRDTTVYLTQTGWHESLQPLREHFPNTFTKDAIMPIDLKARYLDSGNFEYEKFIDFYLCLQSDVFVASSVNMFYTNVAGMRIASGKTQILIPTRKSSTSAMDYLSPYILNRSHLAYSCLCKI